MYAYKNKKRNKIEMITDACWWASYDQTKKRKWERLRKWGRETIIKVADWIWYKEKYCQNNTATTGIDQGRDN